MSENSTSNDFADIPRNPYWFQPARLALRAQRHLIVEENRFVSWSFPLAQLVRFIWEVHEVDTYSKIPGGRNKMVDGTLRLRFSKATVTVQTPYPEPLFRSILSGETSILVRGGCVKTGIAARPYRYYQLDDPQRAGFDRHYVFTGLITVDYDK